MKVLTPGDLARLKAKALEDNKEKELIDDKYFVLDIKDIIPEYNVKHPDENKVLYKSICIPSAINGYSLAIEYMKQWFLSKLPPQMFPEESINIDGKNIFDDYRRLTKQEIITRRKPSLTIVPNINWEFDNDKIDTDMFGLNVYSPTGFWKGSFFKDYDRDMYLGVIMKVLMMQFQFRIRVETRAEQMDLYEFMRLAYRVSYSTGEYSDMDIHIPYDLVIQVARDAGFCVTPENKIKNIPAFLKYLNQNSDMPFIYKFRTINGNSEFFIRMSGLYVHIRPTALEADDGEIEGKTRNNYIVNYECEVRFPAPRLYAYYSSSEHYLHRLFNAEDTKPVYGTGSVVNFATFKATEIPDVNVYGWRLHLTTMYEDEESVGKKLTIDFSNLFEGDLKEVIQHSIDTGVSPDMWISFVLVNNGKLIKYNMDWPTMRLTTNTEVTSLNTSIGIYVDQNYLNEMILYLSKGKNNRIDKEHDLSKDKKKLL